MARWTPGVKGRLQTAAFEVIRQRGFDAVTVAEIAAAAGVTERTFFRHFDDKREVLFGGQDSLVESIVRGIVDAPAGMDSTSVVRESLQRTAQVFFASDHRAHSRMRGSVINADLGLAERESQKMRALSAAIADALRSRGTGEPEASLVAQSAVGVFEVAFRQWIAETEERSLTQIQDEMFDHLSALLGSRHNGAAGHDGAD